MAEEITASSMGESIGLGYRTKDIGPQLMQFQAADLARKSQERAVAKKEKKAEYDKIMDKLVTIGTTKVHRSIQDEYNNVVDKTKAKLNTSLANGDLDAARDDLFDLSRTTNLYKDKTDNYTGIEADAKAGQKVVPDDVVRSIDGKAFKMPSDAQMLFLDALGWKFDPQTSVFINDKGYDRKNSLDEFNNMPAFTKEEMVAYGVTPKFTEDPKRPGYQISASEVYKPTDAMFTAILNKKLEDPGFVANELIRLTGNNSQSYAQLAEKAQADLAAIKKVDINTITAEETNKYMVSQDLTLNHKNNWIAKHTLGEDKSVKPIGSTGSSSKDDEELGNPADVIGSEHLTKKFRAEASRLAPGSKKLTDKQILDIANKPYEELTTPEKAARDLIDRYKKETGKSISHTKYPTVQVQQTTDVLTMPSSKKSITQKVDTIYYDTDDEIYYATLSSTPAGGGVNSQEFEQQVPLTIDDLNALKSSAVNDKKVAKALKDINSNAARFKYPTVDAWIMKNSGGSSANTKPSSDRSGSVGTSSTGKVAIPGITPNKK